MTVLSFVADDRFIVRVVKNLTTNPDNGWANSYEFVATAPGDEGDILDLGTKVVLFEANIHLGFVNFARLLISTWEPDSVPYNPEAFLSTTLTQAGLRGGSGEPIGLGQTFSVARVASSGRFGHLFYRGALVEGDVQAPAGKTVLTSRSGFQDTITGSLEDSGLDAHIAAGGGTLKMCMINKDGSQTRLIQELIAQGVSSVPQDHAWFNRTVAP